MPLVPLDGHGRAVGKGSRVQLNHPSKFIMSIGFMEKLMAEII